MVGMGRIYEPGCQLEGQPLWISSHKLVTVSQTDATPILERNGLDGFDGVIWFQREVEIPAAWQGKRSGYLWERLTTKILLL